MEIQVVVNANEEFKIDRMWEDRGWDKPVFNEFGPDRIFSTDDAGVAALKAFNVPIIASVYGEFPQKKVKTEVKKKLTFL